MNSNLFHLIASYLDDHDFAKLHKASDIVSTKDQHYYKLYKYLCENEDLHSSLCYHYYDNMTDFEEYHAVPESKRFPCTDTLLEYNNIFILLKILQVIVEFNISNHSKNMDPIKSYLINIITDQLPREQPKLRAHKTY